MMGMAKWISLAEMLGAQRRGCGHYMDVKGEDDGG